MPDTFVHIKGILNDACRDDREPNFVSHKFTVRHGNDEFLKKALDEVMGEIFAMQGMIIVKDERKSTSDRNNLYFIPMHRLARIEFETKRLDSPYPDNPGGAIKN